MLISNLQVNIEEKIKNAPEDSGYEIGILIGSYLPLIVLVVLAYLLYRYNKNRNSDI
ncbi:hypothetical protein [Olleya sp. YS]|uniref:hypothetical protein n=1 Tax=Olleya sp. YS TaxID=3028318 RepID=UPI0024341EC4|nr:hypothetical protein [Olleya sp. YS]WGD35906.1 hypothetical protein Ollyesu_05705 [Olleya sp. YS]